MIIKDLHTAEDEIRTLIDSLPPYLQVDASPDADRHLPPWIPLLRHYVHITGHHKILVCHRAFLARFNTSQSPQVVASKAACVEAAHEILEELRRGQALPSQNLWTVIYHVTSASTIILLDLLQNGPQDPQAESKRNEVRFSINFLRRVESFSSVARRGIQILENLLDEESKWNNASYRKKRKAEGGVDQVVKRMAL